MRQFYAKILSQVLFWPAKKIFTQKQLWLSKQIHQQFSVLNVRTEELAISRAWEGKTFLPLFFCTPQTYFPWTLFSNYFQDIFWEFNPDFKLRSNPEIFTFLIERKTCLHARLWLVSSSVNFTSWKLNWKIETFLLRWLLSRQRNATHHPFLIEFQTFATAMPGLILCKTKATLN